MSAQNNPALAAAIAEFPTGNSARPDGLSDEFSLREDGIYRLVEGKDGRRWVWLCSPLRVLALPRDGNGRGWGRWLEIVDPDGRNHRWAMPAELLAGDGLECRRELMRLGLRLSTSKGSRDAFQALLTNWAPLARARTSDRLGWVDEACSAFVLGDGRVIGDTSVVFQSEHAPTAAAEMIQAGTLEGWQTRVAALCVGNPLLIVGVSVAFAGPLLEPLAIEGGGLHLRGASSRGKSTIQRVATSVWGSPRFKHSWRATANGLEGVAAACNGSLLALDELAEISGREAGQAAYMLANGAGKARANRSGAARSAARWRVMILSSGEISLSDKMAEAGERAKAGQAVRLLDIAADTRPHGAFDHLHGATTAAAFADHLTAATTEVYGSAGPAMMEALVDDLDGAREALREAIATFERDATARFRLSAEGQTSRALRRLALIAAAGETATAFGITSWPPRVALNAAMDCLGMWLEGRGGVDAHESRDAIERVRAFLTAHGASRFQSLDDSGGEAESNVAPRPIINRAGWRRGDLYYIAPDVWRTEIHKGADSSRAARSLEAAGLLERGDGKNLQRKVPGGEGGARAFAVRASIIGAGDD